MPPKYRNVLKDVDAFCGWNFMKALLEKARIPFMQGLMAALFGTGGRISEVLALRKWNMILGLHPEVIVIQQMPLLKRFQKVGEIKDPSKKSGVRWITKPIKESRTIPIRISEPASPYLINWYHKVKGDDLLLFPLSRSEAFLRVRAVGEALNMKIPFCNIDSTLLYDHWFRAERASQLAFDYGFTKDDLDEFFQWKAKRFDHDMASRYAGLSWIGLARKMGVLV